MSYLLDKKTKRNNLLKFTLFVIILIIFIYFRSGIFSGLSYVSQIIFRPAFVLGNNLGEKFSSFASYFYSKNSLFLENENLKNELSEISGRLSNYNIILDENLKMKEILGRKQEKKDMILASILSKPNKSPYDTLIIDRGSKDGIEKGQKVFALGDVLLGYVSLTYPDSSKVILFSTPGEKIEVVISGRDAFMQLTGRGGGSYEMILPRDFILEKGTEVALTGVMPKTVGIVQTIISDPRDSFQKALLLSPVNIFELKFVEVEK